jgi:hypothetical protein
MAVAQFPPRPIPPKLCARFEARNDDVSQNSLLVRTLTNRQLDYLIACGYSRAQVCAAVLQRASGEHRAMAAEIHGRGPTEKHGASAERPLNILVVHEMLPHPDRHGADVQWMQMLRELRAQGHKVVHVARSGVNRERYAAGVEALGIPVYAPDAERMRFLGFDFPVEWTFEQLLRENQFDLAILFHWFWNGISIPEHYMEEIRRCSPKTFIAVLTDDQQGVREKQMAGLTGQWSDYERSYDFTSREFQVYGRADVVLTISEYDRNAFLRVAPELVTKLFQRGVPDVYWYHYFSGLVRAWEAESVHPSADSLRAAIVRDEAYI